MGANAGAGNPIFQFIKQFTNQLIFKLFFLFHAGQIRYLSDIGMIFAFLIEIAEKRYEI
jgi:hypothetical protein